VIFPVRTGQFVLHAHTPHEERLYEWMVDGICDALGEMEAGGGPIDTQPYREMQMCHVVLRWYELASQGGKRETHWVLPILKRAVERRLDDLRNNEGMPSDTIQDTQDAQAFLEFASLLTKYGFAAKYELGRKRVKVADANRRCLRFPPRAKNREVPETERES
jgi:hypothetical protein